MICSYGSSRRRSSPARPRFRYGGRFGDEVASRNLVPLQEPNSTRSTGLTVLKPPVDLLETWIQGRVDLSSLDVQN